MIYEYYYYYYCDDGWAKHKKQISFRYPVGFKISREYLKDIK